LRKHGYSERIHGGLIIKAQHRWRCVPLNALTQGSLHYRLATLGYQKQKAMGFVNLQTSFAPLLLLKEMKSKKAQPRWRCVPCYVLTQGSSLCSPTLGYQKQNPDGVRLSHELPLRPLFLLK